MPFTRCLWQGLLTFYTSSQVGALLGDYRTGTAQDAETAGAITSRRAVGRLPHGRGPGHGNGLEHRSCALSYNAPNSVFCPEKPANSSPLNSSPLVTALSPLAFWVQKCGPVPELLLRRVFRWLPGRRGSGSESDSPPRWSVSPPSLSPLKSRLHPAAKKSSKRRVRRIRFSCRTASGMPPNSQVFGGKRLQTTTLFSFPLSGRKSGEFQPAERHRLSPLRHRSLWGRKVRNGKASLCGSTGI